MKADAVILASGFSMRFGENKLLLNLGGKPLFSHILETVKSAVYQFVAGAPRFDDLTMMCLQYNGIPDGNNSKEEKP